MSGNPYAPPESPAGPDTGPPSKVGIRHVVLTGATIMLFLFGAGLVPRLWTLTRAGALSPVIGLLLAGVVLRPMGPSGPQLLFALIGAALIGMVGASMSFRAVQ